MAHITQYGGRIVELLYDEAYNIASSHPFKGNMNVEKLEQVIQETGTENIPFIRLEASTNLIGGQPFSIQNMRTYSANAISCRRFGCCFLLNIWSAGNGAWFDFESTR
ncbi:hypothetical protein FACS1894182_01180 [Bacteroidia bacterium]|nr:hypothetical protein FACS1894182_01180 [Bacteroidia bacterium]